MEEKIRLGISSCLLGNKVRYDGGHKLDRFLANTLAQFVDYVPVCPEVEAGFPVPREAWRLIKTADRDRPRLVIQKTGRDVTATMEAWAEKRLAELAKEELCGFIFKSRSPSCGMERIKVHHAVGVAEQKGVGLFARLFMERFPLLPVEEEGRLEDIARRENFLIRIFALRRWRAFLAEADHPAGLIDFHSRQKLLLMAHQPDLARQSGHLLGQIKKEPFASIRDQYQALFMETLKFKATVKKNTNVLMHMAGYFKNQLDGCEKKELLRLIDEYRLGLIPLLVPLTLLRHYVDKFKQAYLSQQIYLAPHPLELKLRNHA